MIRALFALPPQMVLALRALGLAVLLIAIYCVARAPSGEA